MNHSRLCNGPLLGSLVPPMVPSEPISARPRPLLLLVAAVFSALLCAAPVRAHDGEPHSPSARALAPAAAPAAATPEREVLADEPVIPGTEWATDFQIAPDGDAFVATHEGEIRRYERVGGTAAHPRYDLKGERIWKFSVTKQYDRGLVGIAVDSGWNAGHRFLYAFFTRGTTEYVDSDSGNRIRRTAHLVRIAVPTDRLPQASDLKPILGADALADPDSSCKPYTQGEAAAAGETDALPNGVGFQAGGSSTTPDLNDAHIYPDGDLSTRGDGAYDCIPSDSDTHGPGTVASAPDGSLYVSIGDAAIYTPQPNALRAQNVESYAGKILHIDREGRGLANHPYCPGETDLTRVCTKVWVMGLRNAYRVHLLPPDGATGGQPALAVGDVGNYTQERLTVAHPGDNLGWPCWEGTYFNFDYGGPTAAAPIRSAWGGPGLTPSAPGKTSCERKTATGSGGGQTQPSSDIRFPTLSYPHDKLASTGAADAAIVASSRVARVPGSDPAVALPDEWTGSLLFGDYVRGWVHRISADPTDPSNADRDGGLWLPADENRGPLVQTDETTNGGTPDPIIERVVDPPPVRLSGDPAYNRLTTRQGPDGALWYIRYGWASGAGGIYRMRTAPAVEAAIETVTGSCASGGATQGDITLTAADAGSGAAYAWDLDGDGDAPDRTGRSIVITPSQLAALATTPRWIRLTVTVGTSTSTAARYICAGPTPKVAITAPVDGTQVVLGQPTVVSAAREAADPTRTDIPDSALRWKALTFHGTHSHDLLGRNDSPFEVVDGQQRLQVTVTPDRQHDFGSYSQVRIFAPQADGNGITQTVRLYPKPVDIALDSLPDGASISVRRDGPSSLVQAPGTLELPAGFETRLTAPQQFTDSAGKAWRFERWSDGPTTPARDWIVRAADGAAPVAEYEDASIPETTPPTTQPTTPPPTSEPTTPGSPQQPGDGSTPGAEGPRLPVPPALPPAAPTPQELEDAPLTTALLRGRGNRVTGVRATLLLGRRVSAGGIVVKAAVRDADCRWWSFGRDRFVGRARTKAELASDAVARRCVRAPSWKHVSSSWTADTAVATIDLGKPLPRGRYALRIRVQNADGVLAERVRAIVVK